MVLCHYVMNHMKNVVDALKQKQTRNHQRAPLRGDSPKLLLIEWLIQLTRVIAIKAMTRVHEPVGQETSL